ncbi:TlpA family protein disulfide reductase [Pedobacter steynii]|uniref:Thioredoxin domain-containing protein n=1 Tax=Pedobacter steynii TaxID=430522 RepID=A0A1D7QBL4_9SPHI|nr:thioredoxin family protein [Pedobacter steynii]AOM76072.1 hypothetical protein BFS30_02150 [Pedobacter steynii]
MIDKKTGLLALILILLMISVDAQQRPSINIWDPPVQKNVRNLGIGDTVPDFRIAKIFNSIKSSASMSEYRDQLVIFDFGNLHCKGCVEALPHLDSLEKRFKNKIKIFWVTPEYKEEVEKFWNRKNNPFTRGNNLSTIVEDSTARAYFKHKSWPHEAWVYKGKLVALTTTQYVNADNIQKVLDGQQINWPVKDDFFTFDGMQAPLFQTDENQINTLPITYAAISDYKEGVNSTGLSGGSGIVRDTNHKTIRAFFLNQPIYNSYFLNWLKLINPGQLVKPSSYGIAPNEIVWEVADQSRYILNPNSAYEAEWIRKNGICFESLNPDTGQTDKEVYQSVIGDLDRLLGLHVRWEKRKEQVLVLTRPLKKANLKSKSKLKENDENFSTKGGIQQFRGTPLSSLAYMLNQIADNPYVFDETQYKEPVDMDLRFSSWKDLPAIRKAIAIYGLNLKEEERLVDKLVFTEINGGLLATKKSIK